LLLCTSIIQPVHPERNNTPTVSPLHLELLLRYIILGASHSNAIIILLIASSLSRAPPSNRHHGVHTCSLQGFGHRPHPSCLKRAGPRPAFLQDGEYLRRRTTVAPRDGSHLTPFLDLDTKLDVAPQCFAPTASWPLCSRIPRVYE